MVTEVKKITILKASEGYKLTQSAKVDLIDRKICDLVALGKNSTIDLWTEIPNEEATLILEERQKELQKIKDKLSKKSYNEEDQ